METLIILVFLYVWARFDIGRQMENIVPRRLTWVHSGINFCVNTLWLAVPVILTFHLLDVT